MTFTEIDEDLQRLRQGGVEELGRVFDRHRDRLWQIVQFRLDRRLLGRIDVEDVLQEAYLDAASRLASYLEDPAASPFVWLRWVVNQTMIDLHRRHLGAARRDAKREVSLQRRQTSPGTSLSLACQLAGGLTSPSQAVMRNELAERIREQIEQMDEVDREVLALRHFEELANGEVAEVLEISQAAASARYVRALVRLKSILERVPGMLDATTALPPRDDSPPKGNPS